MALDTDSDNQLIHAYRQGQPEALEFLIQRYLNNVFRFLLRMTADPLMAEDLTQETFLKVWRYLVRYRPEQSFKTWLFTIARNTALDELRKKKPSTFSALETDAGEDFADSVPDNKPLPDMVLQNQDLSKQLEEALDGLAPTSRSVVLLHDTEDLTFQDIADMTGESLNTVKSRYRRAIIRLRSQLTTANQN